MTLVEEGIDMRVDITVWDEIGWRLPPDLIAEDCLESDESAQHVAFELIQVEALVQICKDADANRIPVPDFSVEFNNSVSEYILANDLEADTIDDFYLTVHKWATSVNESIQAQAEQQLEDRESGDYWRE
jgi:hypothetical protein